jgi:hypothetical protein
MMRKLFALVSLLIICATALGAAMLARHRPAPAVVVQALDPNFRVVFSEKTTQSLFGQDHSIEAAWMPDQSQITQLERGFPEAFAKAVKSLTWVDAKTKDRLVRNMRAVARQYSGVVIHGRKLIHVNAFPASFETFDWRSKPLMVSDGGPQFFRFTFDPQTGEYLNFAFNGYA